MLNRNPKRLSAEVFSSAQKQPKQNASSQNREENGSATLRNTREKSLLAGYGTAEPKEMTVLLQLSLVNVKNNFFDRLFTVPFFRSCGKIKDFE